MNWNFRPYKQFESDLVNDMPDRRSELQNLSQKQNELAEKIKNAIMQILKMNLTDVPGVRPGTTERSITEEIWHPITFLGMAVDTAGFEYCYNKDIIYSTMYNFQRLLGYCDLYDLGAILICSRIQSEIIYFTDETYDWRIELWKGQYGIETGGEIGIYRREKNKPLNEIEKNITGALYACVPDNARMPLSFDLKWKHNGASVFTRDKQIHWWLTGFQWGIFSEPEDLSMNLSITLENSNMKDAFTDALQKLGYTDIKESGNEVAFLFDEPKTEQPVTQELFGKAIQMVNKGTIELYNYVKQSLHIETNDPNEIWNKLKGSTDKKVLQLVDHIESYLNNRRLIS